MLFQALFRAVPVWICLVKGQMLQVPARRSRRTEPVAVAFTLPVQMRQLHRPVEAALDQTASIWQARTQPHPQVVCPHLIGVAEYLVAAAQLVRQQ